MSKCLSLFNINKNHLPLLRTFTSLPSARISFLCRVSWFDKNHFSYFIVKIYFTIHLLFIFFAFCGSSRHSRLRDFYVLLMHDFIIPRDKWIYPHLQFSGGIKSNAMDSNLPLDWLYIARIIPY